MSQLPTPEQALKWITDQIELMAELKNATTRDSGFRQWRQNSVTILQRIWPNQPGRAVRFQRVPFTPPSARASEQEARECYGRGFAEARRLLRSWLAEVKHQGLDGADPGMPEGVNLETLKGPLLDRAEDPPATREPVPSNTADLPKLKDMLGFSAWPADGSKRGNLSSARSVRVTKTRKPGKGAARGGDVTAEGPPVAQPSMPADPLAQSIAEAIERAGSPETQGAEPVLKIEPGFVSAIAPETAPPVVSAPSLAEAPAAHPARGLAAEHRASTGKEFAALASDLERCGVPERDRPLVCEALVDLGRRLESEGATWEMLQEAMAFVMQYPGLARRAVPLLLGHFEAAA